jgi:hypothetical protein
MAALFKIAGIKSKGKEASLYMGQMKDFEKSPQNKPLIDVINEADKVERLLQPINGQVQSGQAETSKIGIVRMFANRVQQQELDAAKANPQKKAELARRLGIAISGDALQDDVTYYRELAKHQADGAKQQLVQNARAWGVSANIANNEVEPSKMTTALVSRYAPEHLLSLSAPGTGSAAAPAPGNATVPATNFMPSATPSPTPGPALPPSASGVPPMLDWRKSIVGK